ncbi:hypothetical protein [Geoalkalibacter sp.]|uniref:hypothetical protein n=1 Tax=Geoalkalibacter sp. TaxID=3041440 RepID=UPI00272E75B8|nr:hypothetical protein [Geoalkalibacter sp.]
MFQMELAQFEQAARERLPDEARVVSGRQWDAPHRELWGVVAARTLRLALLPHLECRVAELWPLLFFDRELAEVDDHLSAGLGFSRVNRFFLVVDRERGKCRFGPPHGTLALDRAWRGHGLGSYLLAQLISWGIAHYPGSAVTTEHFDARALDIDRAVLNAFCRRAGIELIFHAPDGATCCAKRMNLLHPHFDRQRVEEQAPGNPGDWFTPMFQGAKVAELIRATWLRGL